MNAYVCRAFNGQRMLCLNVGLWHVRLFTRPLMSPPFAFRRYGPLCFGAGPLGVNVFRRVISGGAVGG